MFASGSRCIYRANQLSEVICQLRFPEILSISTTLPDQFQDAIRDQFPQFLRRQESPVPPFPGMAAKSALQAASPVINYQFSSPDNRWRVNLTGRFISLSCSQYTCWEDFAQMLDKPLAAFIQIYRPAYFERIGLRYLNFISRSDLGLEEIPFRQLITPCYLGPIAEEDVQEHSCSRCSVDADMALRGGCRVKVHAGPGMVKRNAQADKEIKFIFDQDLYMPGKIAVNLSAGALQTLHAQAFPIFRGAITDTLHKALEPEYL